MSKHKRLDRRNLPGVEINTGRRWVDGDLNSLLCILDLHVGLVVEFRGFGGDIAPQILDLGDAVIDFVADGGEEECAGSSEEGIRSVAHGR